jgi:hypothetical protein
MDLFDFFFPAQAQARHLREIAETQQRESSRRPEATRHANELSALRDDVKFLTLVLTTILKRLAQTDTMNLDDVRVLLDEIDELDGFPDGGLEPSVLRKLLGVLKKDPDSKRRAHRA